MKIQYVVSLLLGMLVVTTSADASSKVVRLPFRRVKKSHLSFQKRASYNAPLFNTEDLAYLVSVDIGTPPQRFDVAIDTGSADLWVPGTECPDVSCPSSRFYIDRSSTYKSLDEPIFLGYGKGYANGTYGLDTVTIGGVSVTEQKFVVAHSTDSLIISTSMNQASYPKYRDGLLGLGFPTLTSSYARNGVAYNPFVFNLAAQKVIDSPIFSVYMDNNVNGWSGELTLGGVDPTKYVGDITYLQVAPITMLPNLSDYGYWAVHSGGMGVVQSKTGDHVIDAPTQLLHLLDTGASLSYLHPILAEAIFTAMIDAKPTEKDNTTGAYFVDCSVAENNPSVFQLNLSQFEDRNSSSVIVNVPLNQLLIPTSEGSTQCVFGIIPSEMPDAISPSGHFGYVVGDNILRSMYMVFDASNHQVGLATRNGSDFVLGHKNHK